MKHIKFILGTLLAFQLTGCSDDVTGKYELPVSGDEIQFGAVSQGFSSQSRTVYGLPNGEDAHFGDYTSLTISWLPGQDHVRVYSDVESECQSADYVVQTTTDAGEVLVKDGDIGVRWGDVNKTHHFYSFYPTQRIIEGLQTDATVKANIPVAQEKGKLLMFDNDGKEITTGDAAPWKIIAPDMTYCMLAGKGTWNTGEEKNVALKYTPLVSVLDVVINGPSSDNSTSYNVVAVSVRSKTQNIVGDFTYDMKTGDFTYPTTSGDNKIATVSCIQGEGALSKPTTLHSGEKLNLKFFLLPQDINASELSISVLMEGGYVLTQNLSAEGGSTSDGADGVLASGKISRVITPNIKEPNTNNWMSLIGNDVLFTGLSLPGTRFSYTGSMKVPSDYNPETDILQKYQSLYVATDGFGKTQFDAGIRAFDVDLKSTSSTDIPKVYAGTGNVNMPGTSREMTINEVLTALKNKVQPVGVKATEGVVLFINYVNNELSAQDWITSVNNAIETWNNNNTGVLRSLGPTTTMNEMRGGIAVIVNLVNEGDPKPVSSLINYIDGYGTGRQDLTIKDYAYNGNSTVYVQKLMQVNNPSFMNDPGDYGWRSGIGLVPYYITEAVATGTVPTEVAVTEDLIKTKKLLMNKLIEKIKADGGKSLFINDLSGFCVVRNDASTGYQGYRERDALPWEILGDGWSDPNRTKLYDYNELPDASGYTYFGSSKPKDNSQGQTWLEYPYDGDPTKGNGGNSALFAERFNLVATEAIQEMVNNGRLPMGVVFINFAGEAEVNLNNHIYAVQGIRMPGLIMSNNFLFDLPEKEK